MALVSSATKGVGLIAPHGGRLTNLLVGDEERRELIDYAAHLHSIQLSPRAMRDLEMLAVGAFSPLDRFMGKRDYKCVLNESRLASGHLFPIPITLSVEPSAALRPGEGVALRDGNNRLLAIMTVLEIYEWDLAHEANRVFRSVDPRHPFIAEMMGLNTVNISGPLRVIQLPRHHDLGALCLTPGETRQRLHAMGRANVVAFQTNAPLQQCEIEFVERASQEVDGSALLHPVTGIAKVAATHEFVQALTEPRYLSERTLLALLPLARRLAGPREAVWQMMIQRNYGANHLILGNDPNLSGSAWRGNPVEEAAEVEEIARLYSGELGVTLLPFKPLQERVDERWYAAGGRGEQPIRFAPMMPTAWA